MKHSIPRWIIAVALLFHAPLLRADAPPIDPDDRPIEAPPIAIPKLEPRPFAWTKLALDLPPSIEVFNGDAVNSEGQIVRGWYASIDYSDANLNARAVLSKAPIGREPTSVLAAQNEALIAVNGGYFDMKGKPSKTFSTVMSDGQILAQNIAAASRANGKYFLTRGAFGIRADRSFDVTWIAHFDNKVLCYPLPLPNTYALPASPPSAAFPAGAREWDAREAIGGAPVLIENGVDVSAWEAEAIPPDMALKTHPRTAIGFTQAIDAKPSRLILFVCDGRQPTWSRGLTLPELTQTMRDLGCFEALNLDGGGSSTFVVRDAILHRPTVLNRASDGIERNITSIFAIVQNAPTPTVAQ